MTVVAAGTKSGTRAEGETGDSCGSVPEVCER